MYGSLHTKNGDKLDSDTLGSVKVSGTIYRMSKHQNLQVRSI